MVKRSSSKLAPLTEAEVQQLEGQYERIMALLAGLDGELVEADTALATAAVAFNRAKLDLDIARARKLTAIERSRILKTLLTRF